MRVMLSAMRQAAHLLIRFYQLTLSAVTGRQCRHLPTCSDYVDGSIAAHGLWIGGWMGAARICRCHPLGTDGFDPVPRRPPPDARWYLPWRYGLWRSCHMPDSDGLPSDEAGLNARFRPRSARGR